MRRVVLAVALLWGCVAAGACPLTAAEQTTVTSEVLAKTTTSWVGTPLPPYPQTQPEVTVLRITIPVGAQLPLHKHPVINAGYLTKGQLTVVADDGTTMTLKAGDALVEMVDAWHYGRNDGESDAEIVVFYAGSPGVPLSVLK